MDLEGWLRSLGLGQYEAAFRENAIDLGILPYLTDQDLEEIGVLLGHRRQLMRAIANLETQKAPASTVATPATMDASPRDAAERRQVTGDVLRLGRLNGTVGTQGPRRSSRGHLDLSGMRRRHGAAFRRLRVTIPRRRGSCLFRLSRGRGG